MLKSPYFISLVVPILNEQEIIKETVDIYYRDLKKLSKRFEIIIVDDGSDDKTPQILRQIAKKKPIKIVTHPKNYGVGKALINGFKVARGEWIMHNSADRPFNITEMAKIIPLFNQSDIIVVTRKDRTANSHFRKLTSLTSLLLVKIFFGIPIKDFHFIQIYKKNVLKSVQIKSTDTFMPAELLVKLYKKGYKIKQFQSVFHRRTKGFSKYNNPIRYVRYLKDLINLWLEIKKLSL